MKYKNIRSKSPVDYFCRHVTRLYHFHGILTSEGVGVPRWWITNETFCHSISIGRWLLRLSCLEVVIATNLRYGNDLRFDDGRSVYRCYSQYSVFFQTSCYSRNKREFQSSKELTGGSNANAEHLSWISIYKPLTFTWFTLSASARCSTPAFRIWLFSNCKVVSF